jgi:hypothetical protein
VIAAATSKEGVERKGGGKKQGRVARTRTIFSVNGIGRFEVQALEREGPVATQRANNLRSFVQMHNLVHVVSARCLT